MELYNILEIEKIVQKFLNDHNQGIKTIHRVYFKNNKKVSLDALIAEMTEELKTGCITFVNKKSPIDELDNYLFYIANAVAKKVAAPFKKKTQYLCPSCLYLGKERAIYLHSVFECDDCTEKLKKTTDPKMIVLLQTFNIHNKSGARCTDCKRFIPEPLDNSKIISCPYFDCCFVGDFSGLKKMHHPSRILSTEILSLDCTKEGFSVSEKDKISDKQPDALTCLENKENIQNKIELLKDIIESQANSLVYNGGSESTMQHKISTYYAFNNLLDKYPYDMVDYLLHNSRSGGFQHKIFQEYVKLLENSLPFSYKKKGQTYKVDNILDENLNIFEGISVFEAIISDKLEIKNNTQEFYIGGRKASYTKPYYIGKLLSITEKSNNQPITHLVVEYSFSKIKLKNIKPGTQVIVNHLRIPPHYQMGGMVYINRIRKKIVERAHAFLNKDIV